MELRNSIRIKQHYSKLILVLMLVSCPTLFAQHINQMQKITASDRFQNEQFGFSTDISNHYMIVGAVDEGSLISGRATTEGAAYIYKKSTNNEWVEMQKIIANDRKQDDHFGRAVAISDNFAFVAATEHDFDPQNGDEKAYAGAVYVFKRNTNNEWIQHQKLVASDRERNGSFGNSIIISNNQLIIGSSHESFDPTAQKSITTSGAIYIFSKNSNGDWYETQKLMASDRSAQAYFGHCMAMSGNYIAVGAYWEQKDVNSENEIKTAGAVYIFKKNTDGLWEEHQKITPSDRAKYDFFGFSIAMDGDNLLVGSYRKWKNEEGIVGAAYMFKRSDSDTWVETQKLEALDWGKLDAFGRTVAIKDNIAIIGAPGDYEDKNGGHTLLEAGSVYVFTTDDCEIWHQVEKFTPNKRGYSAGFGASISYIGNDVIISAPDESHDNNQANKKHEAGAVYTFKISDINIKPCSATMDSLPDNQPETESGPIDVAVTITIENCGIVLTANEKNATYQWIDCATGREITTNGNGRSYNPISNSSYAVIITKNDTTLISDCLKVKVIGESSEEDETPATFRVTPNPNNGTFKIIVDGTMTQDYQVDIINAFGISMKKLTLIQSVTQVELGRVNKGVYIVKVKTDEGLKRIPIYIE